jgi:hypothetical protein
MLCILRILKRHLRGVIDAATAYWKGRLQSVYLTLFISRENTLQLYQTRDLNMSNSFESSEYDVDIETL